jgi:hypothetical protein
MKRLLTLAALLPAMLPGAAFAGEVEIVDVRMAQRGDGWTFDVTLRHKDEGWDHYADGWEVRGPDGAVLGHRTLLHPHVNEQPFTRSLSGVIIPEGVAEVTVHAHDKVHGWGASPVTLSAPD